MRLFAALMPAFLIGTTLAPAQAQAPRELRTSGGSEVMVWRSTEAMTEGFRLFRAGVHQTQPDLVVRNLACIVPSSTKAVVTNGGFLSSTILVVDGPQAGCRGVVPNEMLGR